MALHASLPKTTAERVRTAPDDLDADEVKWVIAQLDWFNGARMHATIAALSSGVAASAIGYSMKTRAVFATCGVGDEVVDAATTDTRDAVVRLLDGYARRGQVQASLARTVPSVVDEAERQLTDVLDHVATSRPQALV
jgi:polysaccharide pyruvyl transferase WcaK-like protein